MILILFYYLLFFFFNDTATTEIYTLSLHDALPISRAGAALHRLRRNCLERILLERQAHVLEVEQLLVLLGERVLGLGEDLDQRVLVERVERHGDRQAADELGDQAVAEQVVRLDVAEWVLLHLRG